MHGAAQRMAVDQRLEARLQVVADDAGVLLQPLVARARRAPPWPTAQLAGLPPVEAKNAPSRANASAIARVVMTAPTGKPLPVAFAIVITSGTTPCCSKPQK